MKIAQFRYLFVHAAKREDLRVLFCKTLHQDFLLLIRQLGPMPDHGLDGTLPGPLTFIFFQLLADSGFKMAGQASVFHKRIAGFICRGNWGENENGINNTRRKDSNHREITSFHSIVDQNLYHFFFFPGLYMATLFLPFALAWYRASSARPMNSFFLKSRPVGWALATPILMVTL